MSTLFAISRFDYCNSISTGVYRGTSQFAHAIRTQRGRWAYREKTKFWSRHPAAAERQTSLAAYASTNRFQAVLACIQDTTRVTADHRHQWISFESLIARTQPFHNPTTVQDDQARRTFFCSFWPADSVKDAACIDVFRSRQGWRHNDTCVRSHVYRWLNETNKSTTALHALILAIIIRRLHGNTIDHFVVMSSLAPPLTMASADSCACANRNNGFVARSRCP